MTKWKKWPDKIQKWKKDGKLKYKGKTYVKSTSSEKQNG